MIREAKGFGEDVNEARENALKELGADLEDDVQFEIITTAKKKILGLFGGCKAEVRAFIELPDEKPAKKAPKKPAKKAENKPVKQKKQENVQKAPEKKEKADREDPFEGAVDEALIPSDSPAVGAISYLKKILSGLGCEVTSVKAALKDNAAFIIVDGENVGNVIGRRGETLDAIQYLVSLAADNGGKYYKVSVNIGDYREKREEMLTSLANRIASQVLRTGRSRKLEPMNPYERRIIHTAVQDIEGVVSTSVGEGQARRVIIYPENGEIRPSFEDRGRRPRRPRQDNTVKADPNREPKKDTDVPLYGKIN